MWPTIARRISTGAITLVLLASLVFLLAHAAPGGPAYAILGYRATPSAGGELDKQLGTNTPIWTQYLVFLWHLLHLNLGISFTDNRPVAQLLPPYIGNSLRLGAGGLAIATIAALAANLPGAAFRLGNRHQARLPIIGTLLYATPPFVIATAMIALFAGQLHWLPPAGDTDLHTAPDLPDRLRHLALPALTVGLALFPPLSRYLAEGLREAAGAPYAETAAARGLTPAAILRRHLLRNALRPFVTMLGLSFPILLSGAVTIEAVFGYPGLGWLLWRAALAQDYPVIIAITLLSGFATIAATLLADLAAAWLDPRARFD